MKPIGYVSHPSRSPQLPRRENFLVRLIIPLAQDICVEACRASAVLICASR